ncbi:MAG: hypothetical protein CL831_00045 [Crocinitomicaceae bacterium]|nr:hypothetical protein [Crocinitomicaceae bacterium]|tara:strand:+ start:10550 stop:11002 length:453 start_codon:yes stop_codon:yes gene_type:complete
MKLIAHRGNIDGPNRNVENTVGQIDKCIENGYDVEIDLRYDVVSQTFWLGHNEPKNTITFIELAKMSQYLWIHCKDIATLDFMTKTKFNYFWHQSDDYTMTSHGHIWSYPGKTYTSSTVIVMPEECNINWDILKVTNCYAVCSDYVNNLK